MPVQPNLDRYRKLLENEPGKESKGRFGGERRSAFLNRPMTEDLQIKEGR